MSWMSPFTVPITILPIGSAPVSASSGRRIAMPAFIALAASSTSGTNRMPSRKSMPTMRMPSTSALFEHVVGGPAAAEQDVGALGDLVGQAVVEVVVHLRDERRRRRGRRDRSRLRPRASSATGESVIHDAVRHHDPARSELRGESFYAAFGATTSTVPCAAHTRRPSFSTSMRTTAVRFVSEMIWARASRTPVVTAAR